AALALEAPARPEFRQNIYFSGYGEGWGLYTEWLGTQMGIYETPYEEFGRLTFEMWRAARLVIDTGIHEYGWSRQQAIDYLASHTALARHDVETEVDRYISWPGQALAYYLGYRTILDLRAEAERELGDRFDQRPFHDTVLNLGSVPLPALETAVGRYLPWPGQALAYYLGYRTIRDLRAEAERELGDRFDQRPFHDTVLNLGSVPLPVLEEEVRAFIATQKAAPAP